MFEDTMRLLRRLQQGMEVAIELPLDEAGYLDRTCPGDKCGVYFKVQGRDWFSEKVSDEVVFCPFCRHTSAASAWNTPEQDQYIESLGRDHVEELIGQALSSDARRQNSRDASRPRSGFIDIGIRMEYRPGSRSLILPLRAADVLRQEFVCAACECRWSSFGASFFCPGCGHNSADAVFDRTLEVVRGTVETLATIREALTQASGPEMAADAVRQVVEDQFSRLVGAFERVSEALFDRLPNADQWALERNIFQRLEDGSVLWKAATGLGYQAHLSDAELRRLRQGFQQRHILGHRQGIVDQRYIERSGDRSYTVGQRLIVRGTDVLELAGIIQKLVTGLRQVVHKETP